MTAWALEPCNTAIADFEFSYFKSWDSTVTDSMIVPMQMAIANGNGEWIVPVTSINYGMTKRAMLQKGNTLQTSTERGTWEGMILRFYANTHFDEVLEGLTCVEIANLLDE
jgi:hypothetical protein